jgi:hypothetical protein
MTSQIHQKCALFFDLTSTIVRKWLFKYEIFRFQLKKSLLIFFLLSIYDSHESIGFVHGKSKLFIEVLDELQIFRRSAVRNLNLYRPHRYEVLNRFGFFWLGLRFLLPRRSPHQKSRL